MDLFGLVESFPSPLMFTDTFNDSGDELALAAGGFLAARFDTDTGPGAIAVTNGDAVIVNGFDPYKLLIAGGLDADADGIRDVEELYRNEMELTCSATAP